MTSICRAGVDFCGGLIQTGSSTVFVNGHPVARIGDSIASYNKHSNPVFATGSSNVFADGIGVCRIGDTNNYGDPATTGSPDTFAG